MSNSAYKHLESKLKIAELTIMQWAGVICGLALAIAWGMYLSPLSHYLTLFSAIYLGGIPIMLSLLASQTDFDLWLRARSFARWRRGTDRYVPGPATASARGYVLKAVPADPRDRAGGELADLDVMALWE